ncbi:MAG: valine--tRNA ligase [bacterium]|nr:valine--tRNA ligase [bacterium]
MLEKNYEHKYIEDNLLKEFYELNKVEPKFKEPSYSIVVPPPNVTGSLHMGHALNNTIQDFLIRYHLLKGYDSVWFIGTDHAGIATQNVVEKKLLKQGIKRKDLSNSEFLKYIWEWKEEYGNIILEQFKKLGIYAYFDKARFTMDEDYTIAVKKAFVHLFNKGYIYKGKRVINWCSRCLTSLSDLEVVYKEKETNLYYIKYKLEDLEDYIVIATTRPETLLADTAVAVNPKDERYLKYIGKRVFVPLVNRLVPVLAVEEVDMSFGSGALKVTPAHDFNDYKIYKNLKEKGIEIDIINIFTNEATINLPTSKYHLLERFKAREEIVKDLQELGLLVKIEPHKSNIGHCYRCDNIIEPYYSDQWFIKMDKNDPLIFRAIQAVKDEKIRFYPKVFKKVVLDWYENIEDWCVSRQIVWGHRIPVFYCKDCLNVWADERNEIKNCIKCNSSNIYQEEDVLDTWFSSALWPFAVMFWPDQQKFNQYKQFYYPTNVLTTAREILFLWVSRMIFMSLEFINEIPFKDVIIHAVILAPSGKRMSKSLGTGIDPLELIEKYGADSTRMGLILQVGESQDVKFNYEKIEMARNFINKIWNSIRYYQFRLSNSYDFKYKIQNEQFINLINSWILLKTLNLLKNLENYVKEYRFFDYVIDLYHFVWNVFCDWYIEFTKFIELNKFKETIELIIKVILVYLHPIAPFVSYYIYKNLFNQVIFNITINELENLLNQKLSIADSLKEIKIIDDLIELIKFLRPYINDIFFVSKQNNIKLNEVLISLENLDRYFKNEYIFDLLNLVSIFTKSKIKELLDNQLVNNEFKYYDLYYNGISIRIFIGKDLIEFYRNYILKELNNKITQKEKIEKLLNNVDFINKANPEVIQNYKNEIIQINEIINKNNEILNLLKN